MSGADTSPVGAPVTSSPSIGVVGTDATMVYDALRQVATSALGGLDPTLALEDFTAKDVTQGGETPLGPILDALYTPPFLVERRVVVVRDAQLLLAEEVAALAKWLEQPTPGVILLVAIVGAKSHRLLKACAEVLETNVGSRAGDRTAFVASTFAAHGVHADSATLSYVAQVLGDDVRRADAVARTLASVYGTAPLSVTHVTPYVGDEGDVPVWDLTDALDRGDVATSVAVARRMLQSRQRAGLQILASLERHYLNVARLSGSGVTTKDEAASLLGVNAYPASKALSLSQQLGATRISTAVRWLADADAALKGAVSYGGRDLESDLDVTELTVIEVLVARLARLSLDARRR